MNVARVIGQRGSEDNPAAVTVSKYMGEISLRITSDSKEPNDECLRSQNEHARELCLILNGSQAYSMRRCAHSGIPLHIIDDRNVSHSLSCHLLCSTIQTSFIATEPLVALFLDVSSLRHVQAIQELCD